MCCSDGYHDDLSRPPTVKMDDIKSMEVGEEEEGGWAGHHEEVDYSKEVIFSDSSDEEGSPKKNHTNQVKNVTPSTSLDHQRAESKEADAKSSTQTQECGKELSSSLQPRSPDKSHVPAEKGPHEGKDWWRKPKERNERRNDVVSGGSEMSNRHNVPYHLYSQHQHPGPVMYPQHMQYPPNFNRGGGYGIYQPPPPPQYGPGPSGVHHYPQPQMGGGRYPGSGGGHNRNNAKKTYGERDEHHGRVHNKDGRGSKRRLEEGRQPRPTVLAKERGASPPTPQHDAVSANIPEVSAGAQSVQSAALPIQRVSSLSSEVQEGGSKGHVTFAANVEELKGDDGLLPQPIMRGSQPKLMLRKLEKEAELDGKFNGKEKSGDAKGSRPSDLRGLNSDDPSGSDSNKARMAWNVNERGPIASSKTLYEPEGKKSADKFKKYHAHTQDPVRAVGTEGQKYQTNNQEAESQGAPEEAAEKLKSPTEKKDRRDKDKYVELKKKPQGQEQANGVRRSEQGRRSSDDDKQLPVEGRKVVEKELKKNVDSEKETISHGQVGVDRVAASADSNRHSSNCDRPHHRKEDSRRPRGGGGGGEKRSEFPPRTDYRQADTAVRRAKDGGKRESVESNKTGSNQQSLQEKKYPDQKGKEEKVRRKESLRSKGEGGGSTDKKQTRKDDGRSSAEYSFRGRNNCTASEAGRISEGRPEHRRNENTRGKGQDGGRGSWPPRKGGIQQEESRRREHGVAEKQQHKDVFSNVSTQRKFDSQDVQKEGSGKGEKDTTRPALGYTDLEDVSSSDNEDSGKGKPVNVGVVQDRRGRGTCGRGQKGQHRTEEKGRHQGGGGADRRPKGEPARDLQQLGSANINKRTGKRRGVERRMEEDRDFLHGIRGDRMQRGREKREQDRNTSYLRPTRQNESMNQVNSVATSSSAVEGDIEASMNESNSNRLNKYDLSSHKVFVVDEIGSRSGSTEEWPHPTESGGFVKVTSRKTVKNKMRKEKEEQRKEEEKKLEEQKKRKKKKPAANSGQVGMDLQASTNKPCTAWSSLESKSDGDSWNAAPGSQLKCAQQLQGLSWGSPVLPASVFSIGGRVGSGASGDTGDVLGGDAGLEGGDSKAAVPHTAELVSSSSASANNPLYHPFQSMPVLYYPSYSPSVPSTTSSLLDAAVDSTIGTVTSPRTVSSRPPLHVEDTPLPLDGILSTTPCSPESQDNSASRSVGAGLLPPPHSPVVPKTFPPCPKSVGRGRSMKAGAGDRKDKKHGRFDREHGGKQERTASNPKVRACLHILTMYKYVIGSES